MTRPHLGRRLLEDHAFPLPVTTPRYDRRQTRTGVVHLGVGGFHRSHQAVYLDDLMATGHGDEWAICGVGVLPADRHMADVLHAQDGLYTVVTRKWTGTPDARVIGAMTDYLFAPDDPDAVVERMADPAVRMVTLTVTEGGYNLDGLTGEFDLTAADVAADLRGDAPPRTMYGLVTEALRRRRDRGVAPFAIVSCDNIEHNGSVARRSVTGFAAARDPGLEHWIEDAVAFPSSMVDRITPATTDADRAAFVQTYGYIDDWPVYCEPFTQWVFEDVLGAGQRPELERVGVQFVSDVSPYEAMKLRLLNAGHQVLGYLGMLAGHTFVHEACADEELAQFLRAYLLEATPTVPPVPGIDLPDYRNELVTRFANPGVADHLDRICAFSSDRMPKFVLPAVADNVAAGRDVRCGALVVAAWREFVRRAGDALVDGRAADLRTAADLDDARAFTSDRTLFGVLADDARFGSAYLAAVERLRELGARGAAADARLTDSG